MQLNAERLPRVAPHKNAVAVETEYVNDRQPRYCWAWNIPLLLASVTILLIGGSALIGAYLWQSSRLSSEILDRAAAAEEAQEYKDQVKWLTRYVRLEPNDTLALIRLGIATDNAVKTRSDADSARVRLLKAIAATGDQSVFETQRVELRQRLIKRLLQLGGMWSAEAERQVLALEAKPDDAQALSWFAQRWPASARLILAVVEIDRVPPRIKKRNTGSGWPSNRLAWCSAKLCNAIRPI